MAFKSKITKELQKTKSKKENKEMNKAKLITLTVASTLAVLLIAGVLVYQGFTMGMSYQSSLNKEIQAEAKALTASVQPAPSK